MRSGDPGICIVRSAYCSYVQTVEVHDSLLDLEAPSIFAHTGLFGDSPYIFGTLQSEVFFRKP